MSTIATREAAVRRRLAMLSRLSGWYCCMKKTPSRHSTRHYGAGYEVHEGGKVVVGFYNREHDGRLEDAEWWVSEELKRWESQSKA